MGKKKRPRIRKKKSEKVSNITGKTGNKSAKELLDDMDETYYQAKEKWRKEKQ